MSPASSYCRCLRVGSMTNHPISQVESMITLIRGSADRQTARAGLMADGFGLTEVQANHILDTQLGGLLSEVANSWLDLNGDLPINV
jgi:DNA gyrase/topoisomerase IV subunit A